MLINIEKFWDIAFELTLFLLFVAVCYYFFRKNILPLIYDKIYQNREYKKSLIDKSQLLKKTAQSLNQKIEEQTKLLNLVESKVKTWSSKKIEQNLEHERALKLLKSKLADKRKLQHENLMNSHLQKVVIPQVLKEALSIIESNKIKKEEAFKNLIGTLKTK